MDDFDSVGSTVAAQQWAEVAFATPAHSAEPRAVSDLMGKTLVAIFETIVSATSSTASTYLGQSRVLRTSPKTIKTTSPPLLNQFVGDLASS
jgi:hypothetical protein